MILGSNDSVRWWSRLISLQIGELEARQALEELLGAWSHRNGSAGAALYVRSTSDHRRVGVAGQIAAPSLLDTIPTDPSLQWVELPGGHVLLHTGPAVADASSTELSLLAAAATIAGLKARIEKQNTETMSRGVELVALYEVGLAIASILELEQLGREVLSRALMLLDANRGALYRLDDGIHRLTSSRGDSVPVFGRTGMDRTGGLRLRAAHCRETSLRHHGAPRRHPK